MDAKYIKSLVYFYKQKWGTYAGPENETLEMEYKYVNNSVVSEL